MTATIIQGTTPIIVFTLPMETSTISNIEMTVSDPNGVKIRKTNASYSETYKATFTFTQAETLGLPPGDYRIQLRIKTTDTVIHATRMILLKVAPLASRETI